MKLLTNRQQQIFNLIKNCVEETGYPPTRVEIASKLGFKSPNAAEDHLRALAKRRRDSNDSPVHLEASELFNKKGDSQL